MLSRTCVERVVKLLHHSRLKKTTLCVQNGVAYDAGKERSSLTGECSPICSYRLLWGRGGVGILVAWKQ